MEEQRGRIMLPVNFLRQLIALYSADSMQAMVPGYLEASMEASAATSSSSSRQRSKSAFANSPFAEMAKRNIKFLKRRLRRFKPGADPGAPAAPCAGARGSGEDDVAALRPSSPAPGQNRKAGQIASPLHSREGGR